MALHSAVFSFYSPEKQHMIDVENLRLSAGRWGLGFQVLQHHRFRNWQCFGIWTIESSIRISDNNPERIKRWIGGIRYN